MSEPTPNAPPTVERRSIFPTGNVPKGRIGYLYLGIAVLVVGAVLFSGTGEAPSKAAAAKAAATPPPVQLPSKEQIVTATKELEADVQQLRQANANAEQARMALEAQQKGMAMASTAGGVPAYSPSGQQYYAQPQAPPLPPPDPIEEERKKRAYTSLYASNVALSFRTPPVREQPKGVEQPQQNPPPATAPKQADEKPAHPLGYKLFEGTVIETALQNQLEGSFAGPVKVQVTTAVYSHDRQHVLIPQGSLIYGSTEEVQDSDQRRLAVIFHRLIMPDGFSVDLDKATGLDQVGATALRDKVNTHLWSKIATSVALGAIAGLSLSGTNSYYSPDGNAEDMYRQSVAREFGQTSRTILQKQINRMPEITIRPGHRVKVWLQKDIYLPAYDSHPRVPGV
jgi:type IV secretory pathway VirB10-like protein